MYNLTVTTEGPAGRVLRHRPAVLAPQALRDWFEEETTGYLVTCQDEKGASVTKAQLREVARRA